MRAAAASPLDEVRGGLVVFEQTLCGTRCRAICASSIARSARTPAPLPLDAAPIRFGSWIGGDRDGNPNVTPESRGRRACWRAGWPPISTSARSTRSAPSSRWRERRAARAAPARARALSRAAARRARAPAGHPRAGGAALELEDDRASGRTAAVDAGAPSSRHRSTSELSPLGSAIARCVDTGNESSPTAGSPTSFAASRASG